ncbi:MAG: hypothetical protein M1814_003830 [Vezdaea aestivalis]|nr:MAG: hypothetical protein M1814_003830 [Vezdaea aestivalis]
MERATTQKHSSQVSQEPWGKSQELPPTFHHAQSRAIVIAQGAEAVLYKTSFFLNSLPCALKYRPPKLYRHPILDTRLTRHRILAEARVLVRCRKDGISVPGVYALDAGAGWLALEWIEGLVVREVLRDRHRVVVKDGTQGDEQFVLFMQKIGQAVGLLHRAEVVHGDLTTSNMILRPGATPSSESFNGDARLQLGGDIVLIDFGLASQSSQEEDRAVDLYVLERAFGSTHPKAEKFFAEVLEGYSDSYKGAKGALKKLEDVRMRGRKKSMIG